MCNDVFTTLGASNHIAEERQSHDYYATDPIAVEKLLEVERFNDNILECCCGEGHISKVLEKHGYNVTSEDLIDRGYGIPGKDFFKREYWVGDIVTNPPYKQALEFVSHSLDVVDENSKVAMLLKIQFLEGQERYKFFKKSPPKTVYVFSKRILCAKNGDFTKIKSSAICYAWFIWEKGHKNDPIIRWIM